MNELIDASIRGRYDLCEPPAQPLDSSIDIIVGNEVIRVDTFVERLMFAVPTANFIRYQQESWRYPYTQGYSGLMSLSLFDAYLYEGFESVSELSSVKELAYMKYYGNFL